MTQEKVQNKAVDSIDNRSEARAYIYKWLQEKFQTPKGEKYSNIDTDTLREALKYIGINNLEDHIVEMEESMKHNYDEKNTVLEYCKLFYGPNKLACPPFGSYYVDTQIPMNKSAVLAQEDYAKWGLILSKDAHNFPDHISIELEFLYYLAVKEEEARGQGDYVKAVELVDAQKQFLAKHLFKWIPSFTDKTLESTEMKLFSGLVKFIRDFIQEDYTLIEDIKKQYKESITRIQF